MLGAPVRRTPFPLLLALALIAALLIVVPRAASCDGSCFATELKKDTGLFTLWPKVP
jgi:hypothetical protein